VGDNNEIRVARPGLHRALIECTRDIHTVLDSDGIVVYQSPSLTAILGWSPEDMLGSSGFRHVHPDDLPRVTKKLDTVFDGTEMLLRLRLRMRAKDGRWVHLDSIVRNELANPEIRGILIMSRDVSGKVDAEHALREREHLLRTVEGHPCLILWALDKEGIITVSQGAGLAVLGLEPGQAVGMSVFDLYVDTPNVLGYVRRALAGETLDYTLVFPGPDGPVTTDNRLRPQFSENDEVVGVTAITFDVSDREELESELRRAKTMESIGMLAGGIAHDFNNLLTAIVGFASAAKHSDAETRDSYLEQVIEAGQRGGEIVGQLLSFARKDEICPETVDLAMLIENSLSLYRQVLGDAIEIELGISDRAACYVEIDRSKLEQVFLNLVTNARDAMPDGGLLTIQLSHDESDDTDLCVRIDVVDNGLGMTANTVECAFEPFYSTKESGTGLGLATTHGIVTRAGGLITVQSTLGKGTTFQLCFPCSSSVPAEVSENFATTQVSGLGRILLIDDNTAVLHSTALTLEFYGYQVRTAESGQEGYDTFVANQDDIDLVITDMTMPGMKGDELVVRVREIDKSVPILCVSGHHDPSKLLDGLERVALLSKPYLGDDLNEAIARLLTIGR
jgi:two-component system cell cycle sensor histidine kinase/response regulator CckA